MFYLITSDPVTLPRPPPLLWLHWPLPPRYGTDPTTASADLSPATNPPHFTAHIPLFWWCTNQWWHITACCNPAWATVLPPTDPPPWGGGTPIPLTRLTVPYSPRYYEQCSDGTIPAPSSWGLWWTIYNCRKAGPPVTMTYKTSP